MGSKSFTNKVVGIFTDRFVVDSVLNELNNNGFDSGDISVLARDMDNSDRIVTHSSTTYPVDTEVTLRDDLRTGQTGTDVYPRGTLGNVDYDETVIRDDYPTGSSRLGSRVGDTLRHVDDKITGRDSLRNNRDYDTTLDRDYDRTIDRNIDTTLDRDYDRTVDRDFDRTVDRDLDNDKNYDNSHDVAEKDPKAMVKGATAGGALGLIAGIGMLLIPGVGPVLAAGPIAAALTAAAGGAAVGATAGTLLGLLKDEGIPNDRADFYNRHFNKGNVLIMVHTDEGRSSLAREILVRHNPETIDTF